MLGPLRFLRIFRYYKLHLQTPQQRDRTYPEYPESGEILHYDLHASHANCQYLVAFAGMGLAHPHAFSEEASIKESGISSPPLLSLLFFTDTAHCHYCWLSER